MLDWAGTSKRHNLDIIFSFPPCFDEIPQHGPTDVVKTRIYRRPPLREVRICKAVSTYFPLSLVQIYLVLMTIKEGFLLQTGQLGYEPKDAAHKV